jgi:hypothetical protein
MGRALATLALVLLTSISSPPTANAAPCTGVHAPRPTARSALQPERRCRRRIGRPMQRKAKVTAQPARSANTDAEWYAVGAVLAIPDAAALSALVVTRKRRSTRQGRYEPAAGSTVVRWPTP